MGKLIYKVGDATNPCVESGTRIIIHICNSIGSWGSGFVVALSKKWKQPEMLYKQWFSQRAFLKGNDAFQLGNIQKVALDVDKYYAKTYVINMIAQDGIMSNIRNDIPLRYDALEKCLQKVYDFCSEERKKGIPISVHCPRLGAGLAGGDWNKIEKLIEKWLVHGKDGFDTYVYDLSNEVGKWKGTVYDGQEQLEVVDNEIKTEFFPT